MRRQALRAGLTVPALAVLVCIPPVPNASAALVSAVQTGTAVSTGAGTVSVPISSVDPAKSFLIFQVRHNSNVMGGSFLRGRIASATTLEFVRETTEGSPATMDVRWHVVEFSSGVNVQRGEADMATTTVNVPITAVAAVNQAFVIWSKTALATDSTWGDNDPILGELTSTTNLQFRVERETSGHTIWWQVIEFTNAADINVQKGSITTMTGATTSVTATLSPAVDVDRTFVLVGFRSVDSGADVGARMLRARLTNSTTITIDRSISGSPDAIPEIVWQAVELKDGSTVRHGSANLGSGTSQVVVPFAPPVATDRSVAFASVQPVAGQAMGRSPYAGDDIIGVGSVTMALASSSITMDRNNTSAEADVGWFVVQFKRRRVMRPN